MAVWYESDNPNGFVTGKKFSIDEPFVTVMAGGAGGDSLGHWNIVNDGKVKVVDHETEVEKPPYRVPLMREIEAVPWNGYKLISTFSGCGGSCLGFRMAGFRTIWASEFVEAARVVYSANHHGVTLDARDIRDVDPKDVLASCGIASGELDVLEGSPPCASFSTAGKRHKAWNQVKKYSETKQRTDDLFFEFARMLNGLQPKTFVAENVSGLVKGVAKGYFLDILSALKSCGYVVKCKVLDAQWLGVPQRRQRTIFVGVRNDLVERFGVAPTHPKPLPYRYALRDAIPWITQVQYGDPKHHVNEGSNFERGVVEGSEEPVRTVKQSPGGIGGGGHEVTARCVHDTKGQYSMGDVTDQPCPTVTQGGVGHLWIEKYAIGDEWDKLRQGESSDKYLNLVRASVGQPCPTVTQTGGIAGAAGVLHPVEKRKFSIAELKRVCGFPDDFVLTGSYAQQWERLGRAVPPPMMRAVAEKVKEVLDACAESLA